MVEIGSKIKTARLAKKLTQKKLAEELHVTPQTISKWELGKSWPDLAMVSQLCQVLDLEATDLLAVPAKKKSLWRKLLTMFNSGSLSSQPTEKLATKTIMLFEVTDVSSNYTPHTLLLTTKMHQAAKKRHQEVDIQIWSASKLAEKGQFADAIVLCPSFAYASAEVKKAFPMKKVVTLDPQVYGLLNGSQVLLEALED